LATAANPNGAATLRGAVPYAGLPDIRNSSGEEDLLARVQTLTERVDRLEDPVGRAAAQELVAAVLEMHGVGLAKIGEVLDEAGAAGEEAKQKLVADGVVASLLLIHDLYPVSLEARVREGLEEVRPYMESHEGDVELLGVEDGVVRLRLKGSCDGCPASAATLELAIKEALEKAAPDMAGLEVEGVVAAAQPPAPAPSGIELPVIQPSGNGVGNDATPSAGSGSAPIEISGSLAGPARHDRSSRWLALDGPTPVEGEVSRHLVDGRPIVVANVDDSLLAFRDACAACGEPIAGGNLEDGVLDCPACERRFYLPRAGRSMDAEKLLLEPVPLLSSGGAVTVAVATDH
jgi:Fe-S cluster biogenesis protein NfuA/nitrite reductase/ring-hydroxylating ferredoxin subunit